MPSTTAAFLAGCGLRGAGPLQLQHPSSEQLLVLTGLRERLRSVGWYAPAGAEYAVQAPDGQLYGWAGAVGALFSTSRRRDLVVYVPASDDDTGTGYFTDDEEDDGYWVALVGDDLVEVTATPGLAALSLTELAPARLAVAGGAFLQRAQAEVDRLRGQAQARVRGLEWVAPPVWEPSWR